MNRQRSYLWMAELMASLAGCSDGGRSPAQDPDGIVSVTDEVPDAGSPRASSDAGSPAERAPDAGATLDGGDHPVDAGSGPTAAADAAGQSLYGSVYSGGEFHLGPVDYAESAFHNACAAAGGYLPAVQAREGSLLAGLWAGLPEVSRLCDACIRVSTARGKSAVLRVVTYGGTTPNSIDVSPEAYAFLDSGEYPRAMDFQLTRCPDTGAVQYEFLSGAHEDWTAFWVRNPRVPIASVEAKSAKHQDFRALRKEGDGTLVDDGGFGVGAFTIRITAVDGSVYEDTFAWPSGGISAALLEGHGNL
jgi:expansin (peptidoglycan-binding protein)